MRAATVALLSIGVTLILGCGWRVSPQPPPDCPLPLPFVEDPGAALVNIDAAPSGAWKSDWHWNDDGYAGPRQTRNPGGLDGIGFEARLADFSPLSPILIVYYIFEFEVPPVSCPVSIDWDLTASVRFPQGLCARPVGGNLIEIGCTDEDFGGRFWIESFSFPTIGRPGLTGGDSITVTALADARDPTTILDLPAETADPFARIVRFDGDYTVGANQTSRVYVGLSLFLMPGEAAEICTGNRCTSNTYNLVQRAVFSVAELNFEMTR